MGKAELFFSVYVDDITMVGRQENSTPMWAEMQTKFDFGEPTPLIDRVYSGCTQTAPTSDD